MDAALIITQLMNGLQLGVLLFLLASGLTLVFGIMDFVNLAHGSFYMVGAFVSATLVLALDSFFLGVLLAVPIVVLIGVVTEVVAIKNLYARDHLDHVLATFGLILIFDELTHIFWGPVGISVPLPIWLQGQVEVLPNILLPSYRLVIIGAGLGIAGGLYYLVTHTRLGMLIRAGASNRTMVGVLGIDIKTLFTLVFAIGAGLAGFAGMLVAPITNASVGMGNDIIITAFVVIIVGGIGSMKGAFVAAVIIGLIDTMGRSYLDDFFKVFLGDEAAETSAPAVSAMLIYILMAFVLTFRPQGLFPPKVR